jgi:hypothetical protein
MLWIRGRVLVTQAAEHFSRSGPIVTQPDLLLRTRGGLILGAGDAKYKQLEPTGWKHATSTSGWPTAPRCTSDGRRPLYGDAGVDRIKRVREATSSSTSLASGSTVRRPNSSPAHDALPPPSWTAPSSATARSGGTIRTPRFLELRADRRAGPRPSSRSADLPSPAPDRSQRWRRGAGGKTARRNVPNSVSNPAIWSTRRWISHDTVRPRA